MVAFKKLKSVSTVIFVNSNTNDWRRLPRSVQNALNSSECGRIIPKTVVMSADLETCIAKVRYEEWKSEGKTVRKVKNAIKAQGSNSEKQEKDEEEPTATKTDKINDRKLANWTNSEGRKVKARFVKLNADSVTLQTMSGKNVDYPLSRLSAESKLLAKALEEQYNQ